MVISSDLFKSLSTIIYWKIEFKVVANYTAVFALNGSTQMILKINEPPSNGTCAVDPPSGYALIDYFQIKCIDWLDTDGLIVRYEFFGKNFFFFNFINFINSKLKKKLKKATFLNNTNPIALNFNQKGLVNIQLPQGPAFDGYKLTIFVQVIDDLDSIGAFVIPNQIVVEPKAGIADKFTNELLSGTVDSNFMRDLNSGDIQLTSKNIISLASLLNNQIAIPDEASSTGSSERMLSVKQRLLDIAISLVITDVSSIKVIASVLSGLTENGNDLRIDSAVFNFLLIRVISVKVIYLF